MKLGSSRALEAGWEHLTQESIVLGVEDHCLVEMQHVIVWIGRTVVHCEGWYGEAAGRIVVQDMLSKGSGEHVLWSPDGGEKNHLRSEGSP